MKEILYSGKMKNGKWAFGLPFYGNNVIDGLEDDGGKLYRVDPETIRQYSGEKDKNGKKIFEGDIHKNDYNDLLFVVCLGAYHDSEYEIDAYGWYMKCTSKNYISGFSGYEHCYVNIIGNVHDNPELLEVKAND